MQVLSSKKYGSFTVFESTDVQNKRQKILLVTSEKLGYVSEATLESHVTKKIFIFFYETEHHTVVICLSVVHCSSMTLTPQTGQAAILTLFPTKITSLISRWDFIGVLWTPWHLHSKPVLTTLRPLLFWANNDHFVCSSEELMLSSWGARNHDRKLPK